MALSSRPWFRLTAVGVLTLVGIVVIVVIGMVVASFNPLIPLPYHDSLVSQPHVMDEWDHDVTRARYAPDGYELLVKEPGRTAAAIPGFFTTWDLSIRVTLQFRAIDGSWPEDGAAPTAGVICTGDDADYDFRVGVDGRYALYRWSGRGAARASKLLASNSTLGRPRIAVRGPITLVVECQRRSPTTLKLSVDGNELLSVSDTDARNWGLAGVIVGSGNEPNVSAVFTDLSISGR